MQSSGRRRKTIGCFLRHCIWGWLAVCLVLEPVFVWGENPLFSEVVVVKNEEATEAFRADAEVIGQMVKKGLCELTQCKSVAESMGSLVSTNDVVGIKVYALRYGGGGTRVEVVKPLVEALKAAGVAPDNIVIWDRSWESLYSGGFVKLARECGIQVQSAAEAGFDETVFYSSFFPSSLVAGDVEFGKKNKWNQWREGGKEVMDSQTSTNRTDAESVGRRSFVSKLLTQKLTKIILVTPLIHHNSLGAAGNIYSLASGCTDNFLRFEADGYRLAEAASEIYAMEAVGDKVVLSITDALLCQYQGQNNSFLHYSVEINELRFSKDPVALDAAAFVQMVEIRQNASKNESSAYPEIPRAGKTLCENAVLLELGNASADKVHVRRFLMGETTTPTQNTPQPQEEVDRKRSWWKFWKL